MALAAATRLPDFAEAPTFEELGLPGFLHRSWSALLVPATVPTAATARLREAALATAHDGEVRHKLAALGLGPVPLATAEEAQAFLEAETRRYRGMVSAASAAAPGAAP